MLLHFPLYCEYCWKKMSVSKIFLWASRIFSKVTLLVSDKGKKPTVTRAPSLTQTFLHCMLPTSRKSNPSPVLPVPPAGSLVQDSLRAPRSHHSHTAPWGAGFPGGVGLEGSFELPLRSTLLHCSLQCLLMKRKWLWAFNRQHSWIFLFSDSCWESLMYQRVTAIKAGETCGI